MNVGKLLFTLLLSVQLLRSTQQIRATNLQTSPYVQHSPKGSPLQRAAMDGRQQSGDVCSFEEEIPLLLTKK